MALRIESPRRFLGVLQGSTHGSGFGPGMMFILGHLTTKAKVAREGQRVAPDDLPGMKWPQAFVMPP